LGSALTVWVWPLTLRVKLCDMRAFPFGSSYGTGLKIDPYRCHCEEQGDEAIPWRDMKRHDSDGIASLRSQ
jgi:hypothetical protein